MKYFSKLKDYIIRFSTKGLSNDEIALSIALGNFIGFVPVIGTHTIMAIALASTLRLNILIVLLGTQISNPISFPFQIFISAEIGNLILNGGFLEITFSREISYLKHYILPIIVGSVVLGISVSGISYLLTKSLLKRRKGPLKTS
jgi:uncharacterized protein (DUF2062 family)